MAVQVIEFESQNADNDWSRRIRKKSPLQFTVLLSLLALCLVSLGAAQTSYTINAFVQPPINADGSSVFIGRGVIPVKFTLRQNGIATRSLPPATISVTRTAGGTLGSIDPSVYRTPADSGSNFRIAGAQYIYNLAASSLGAGTYRVDISIAGNVVGQAVFKLQ